MSSTDQFSSSLQKEAKSLANNKIIILHTKNTSSLMPSSIERHLQGLVPQQEFCRSGAEVLSSSLHGDWDVVYSSLPMWHDGKKIFPCISYRPLHCETKMMRLLDTVRYFEASAKHTAHVKQELKKMEVQTATETLSAKVWANAIHGAAGTPTPFVPTESIEGIDIVHGDIDIGHITWSGKSFPLSFISSHWYILIMEVDLKTTLRYIIIFFTSTLFTPEGIDVLVQRRTSTEGNTHTPPSPNGLVDHDSHFVHTLWDKLRHVYGHHLDHLISDVKLVLP